MIYKLSALRLDPVGENADKFSVLGEKSDSLVQSGGQLLGQVALASMGVPWWVTSGLTSFGGEAENAFKRGANYGQAIGSGLISAGAEILSEKLFGGSGLGEKGLINVEKLTKGISDKALKLALDYGIDVVGEGAEEVVSQLFGNLGSALYRLDEESWRDILVSEEAMDGYLESLIGGMVLGGVANAGKTVSSAKKGTDYRTGRTESEQKVFDALLQEQVGDKKLSTKELAKLEAQIQKAIDDGDVSLGTIESTLAKDSYEALAEARKTEATELEEYKKLSEIPGDKLSRAQEKRLNELESRLEDLQNGTKSKEITKKLFDQVLKGDTNGKLARS